MELALELFEKKKEETKTQLDDMSLEDLQDLMDELGIDEDNGVSDSMTVVVEDSEDGEEDETRRRKQKEEE